MFLFRLVRAFKPVQILELGANLGVSSAYLRCAADINTNNAVLTTIENDSTLSTYAKKTLGTVSNQPSTVLTGSFVEVLPTILQGDIKFDFVLIKGYRYRVDETVKCFQMIEPFLNKNACVVFDDIYPRASSNRPAWRRIQIDRTEALFYDFWRYGVMIA
jgi:predicted O-methyltransferase YrrM